MSFSVSPAVTVREIDLSTVVGEQVSTLGSFAGKFVWGPVGEVTLVSDEVDLVNKFGKPNNDNYVDFFSAASFFAYSSGMNVVRIGEESVNASYPAGGVQIKNRTELDNVDLSAVSFAARYPGSLGNGIDVAVCTSATDYSYDIKGNEVATEFVINFGGATPVRSRVLSFTTATGETAGQYLNAGLHGDFLVVDGVRYKVAAINEGAKTITLDRIYVGVGAPTTVTRLWAYAPLFGAAPVANAVHVVLIDRLGQFTGEVGGFLEDIRANLSTVPGTVDENGNSVYWVDVLNASSQYVYAGGLVPANTTDKPLVLSLVDGDDSLSTIGDDDYIFGYELFANSSEVEAPLIIAGDAIKDSTPEGATLANYLIQNIAEVRKDSVVFISPSKGSVVGNRGREANSVIANRKLIGSTSYAMMDSGWKYMYDKYNATFRWVPLNGDHAGIYARNDRDRETWVSAAGTSKGRVKNVVKFAWNPDKVQRDALYINDVNPFTNMPVAGPTVMGDKTLLGKNSAFSRINVRRLFIALEKAISTAAADLLFEFNDEFTQRRFVSMVEPFLKDVKGRRGITDFKVVADSTVNTPQVVQNNRFVGQIYVKPNYSINFIRLDFVAVNAAASFEEVVGSV